MSESPDPVVFTEPTGANAPVDKSTAPKDAVAPVDPTETNVSVEKHTTVDKSTAPKDAVAPVDGPSHAERAAQILGTARATLARSRGNNQYGNVTNNNISSCANAEQFRERPAEVPGASGRARGLASSCARPADPPRQQIEHIEHIDAAAWWAAIDERIAQALATERAAILEEITPVIRSLREMYEALHEQLTETRWQRLGSSFGTRRSAFRALKKWEHEECTRIEAMSRSCDDEGKKEPLENPAAAHPAPEH